MTTKSIQPSFLLKYIQPSDLVKKYKSGYFNRPIPTKAKIVLDTVRTTTRQSGATLIQFIKSNQTQVDHYVKNHSPLKGGRCDYCKQDFSTEVIGYPISYECQPALIDERYHMNHLFWVEGCHCSYSCCLAFIKHFNIHQDFILHDVEILLRFLYKLDCNTNDNLLPANDFRLLHNPLTPEEWRQKQTQYTRTNHVTKIPGQVTYMKQIC